MTTSRAGSACRDVGRDRQEQARKGIELGVGNDKVDVLAVPVVVRGAQQVVADGLDPQVAQLAGAVEAARVDLEEDAPELLIPVRQPAPQEGSPHWLGAGDDGVNGIAAVRLARIGGELHRERAPTGTYARESSASRTGSSK